MTTEERRNPDLLASSQGRRQRVARGSGHNLNDVSKLVSDFQRMRTMMQQMGQYGGMPGMPGMGGGGMPGGMGMKPKKAKKKKGFGDL
jgi:signal recognition particle subunit SRP54